jgi:hypothetical protein
MAIKRFRRSLQPLVAMTLFISTFLFYINTLPEFEYMKGIVPFVVNHHPSSSLGRQHTDTNTSIIITTSLIPTHPSLDMINTTIQSIYKHLHGLSPSAPLFIACDGLKESALESDRTRFEAYVQNLKDSYHGPHETILVGSHSLGILGNVKQAMDLVDTEFVYVIQHDMPFIQPIEHALVIKTMKEYPDVMRLVRFNKSKNRPWRLRNRTDFVWDEETPVNHVNGIHFCKTLKWSDNNHLTRKSYYDEIYPLFGNILSRPMEGKMMTITLTTNNTNTRWATFLYGDRYTGPYIGHLDGRGTKVGNNTQ